MWRAWIYTSRSVYTRVRLRATKAKAFMAGRGLAFAYRQSIFFFSSRRRHTRCSRDWSSDVCSSDLNADNIVVSNSSKQSLFNVCFTLFGPGEVVAIPAPAWVSYPQIVYLSRARPVLVPGEPEWSLKVSVRDLDRVVPGARGLILCSPCNPTGAVYTQAEIKAIAHWARDRKVWIVADGIYRRIHYGAGPSPSLLDLP